MQQLRRALKNLESSGEITQTTTNKFRLITLEKWDFFQGETENATDKQQANNRQTTGVKKESKELNNIISMTGGKKKPKKQNRFINYTQSEYDFEEIERQERELKEKQMKLEV